MGPLRFVTAASLFDGHDVSINIMRRILQSKGVEVIHLGHNRSAKEVVDAALCEDAHAVAVSSYQGGHNEYFTYIRELLNNAGAKHIKIFGGGGGVIVPREIKQLEKLGIDKIYGPEDGMKLGLEGIILDMIERASFNTLNGFNHQEFKNKKTSCYDLARLITFIEDKGEFPFEFKKGNVPVLGITGTGGAGKSSIIDEILLRLNHYFPNKKVALISIDPTKKKTQGALLGDRIRLGSAINEQFFIRSLATRSSTTELSPHVGKVVDFIKDPKFEFDLILVETSGIGQASDAITSISDKCIYVMTPEYGAESQLEKIEMLDVADFVVLNKFEKPRSEDSLRDIRKQYRRTRGLFAGSKNAPQDVELPIFPTRAARFNNPGLNSLFISIAKTFNFTHPELEKLKQDRTGEASKETIIPVDRTYYLREIAKSVKDYNNKTNEMVKKLENYEALEKTEKLIKNNAEIIELKDKITTEIGDNVFKEIKVFENTKSDYAKGEFTYVVRGKDVHVKSKFESLSGLKISRVSSPNFHSMAEKYAFIRNSNLPGFFPFAAGIFPFKRADEEPKRQFAGEGGPKRTNKRFHFLSQNDTAKRLSTAFDSVTLYGEDPDYRPDIFGKIGEAGVSICTVEDMEDLFKGFSLIDPNTSVSMTINGPASIILAMYMNAALRQVYGKDAHLKSFAEKIKIIQQVRGTVQADILKEDQAQNTCIFSLDFSLKLMGDVQEFFSQNQVKNYYTVSISGYHIAEAGANPITQLAFTLANGFTYVEYYLSRGLSIDNFSQNLSFFFSNGLDPEYSVIGRVARKIWAVAMKEIYGANVKSQMLKYHIQTSGRSLHAQEIDFNDIRTTLQAYLALSDNCNSLHTNAYDEAITTPTEESVRRAMAIQMIINREFGINKSDNPMQGAYLIEELCALVEEAVLIEFEKISDKGGVLGAMETMYQRGKIQEDSMYYERLKDSGELPIIGVNTYVDKNIEEKMKNEIELSRADNNEKEDQIKRLEDFKSRNKVHAETALKKLEDVILNGENIFNELLSTVNFCSLGQITSLLYKTGGKYRRNM